MRMIQSSSNPRLQKVKKLLKSRKQNLFLVEGKKLFQEAIDARFRFQEIFATPEAWARERNWLETLERKGTAIFLIAPALLRSISDVKTPQGLLGLVHKPSPPADSPVHTFAILLISVRDPGNFGAIVRTSEACGCEWIGYSSDCVDPFQSKVVRASMGSLFRVPLIEIHDPVSFLTYQNTRNIPSYGLVTRATRSLMDWKPQFPLIICIGSESHGLPDNLPLTETISIPMKGRVESLNAAVAAAVCLYSILKAMSHE